MSTPRTSNPDPNDPGTQAPRTNHPGTGNAVSLPFPPRDLGRIGGYRVWSAHHGDARVLFVGRGPDGPEARERSARQVLERVTPGSPTPAVAGARQVHGATVLEATEGGVCGEGDALVTDRPGLAVSVVTADCVPVLLRAGDRVAAIHAGWRGVVAGVVPATVERLRREGETGPAAWQAWIGPAIGACCYEVGPEVAEQVGEATTAAAVVLHPGKKPHVDLVAAVRHQLVEAGVPTAWLVRCTRCDSPSLWSYRELGEEAGRNFAFLWREATL